MKFRIVLALLCAGVVSGCSGGGGGGGGGGTDPQFGTVAGTVTRGGAPVQGVTVSVSGGGTGTTSAAGAFSIGNVPVGSRIVSVTLPDGSIAAAAGGESVNLQVAANQTAAANFTLVLGRQVTANAATFSPVDVTLPLNGTVRWVTNSGTHTVTPDNAAQPGAWAGVNLTSNFQHAFTTPGTYPYHCNLHAGMTGTVTVTP